MKKIAFIGAGSHVFTRSIVRDLLLFPSFEECEIALMDIHEKRLADVAACCRKLVSDLGSHAEVTVTMSRAEALSGADGVLCTVFNGDIDIWRQDLEIPMKYGVDMNIGDTRSVSGIFRALRNIPLMLDICADIEKYCPNAVFLNYTNPMAILCGAMQKYTKVDVTGLCHSVQGTADMLAKWLGFGGEEEIDYLCAGVNHQAFYLRFEHQGEDLYPRLRELLTQEEYYNKEIVRNEMFRHLDYYVTESSGHNSEYNAWFRKRPDLIERYCTHGTGWNPGAHGYTFTVRAERARDYDAEMQRFLASKTERTPGKEYAANIFNARFGDGKPYRFNANVLNRGCIENLPYDACVEIPVVVDRVGLSKIHVGKLPAHLAILVNTTAAIENLVIEAAMEKDRRKVFQAVCMDPLTSAVCSLQEIYDMCEELFAYNRDFLGDYRA